MTGEFFGVPFSLPHAVAVTLVFVGSAFGFWTAYRSISTSVHEWRTDKVHRAETPRLFAFHVGLSLFLGFVALAGGIVMAFDLGMKP